VVTISEYAGKIHDPADKPLFDDAAKSAAAGALRGAYVMLWLACAESLKRKFKEAERRDGTAGKIVGNIASKEREQRSVDKFILENAKEYGFISESAYKILLHIYDMRCVYGHPYEEAPDEEQVAHAAAMVVQHVLSQPVRLRHGYCKQMLKSLLGDKHFLDDQASAVHGFVAEVLPRIDESVYDWFLDAYWKELEKIANDASLKIFFFRGVRFTQAVLARIDNPFTPELWHGKASAYPKTLIRVLNRSALFKAAGKRAQDSLVSSALDIAKTRASILRHLEGIIRSLTERQKERFLAHVREMSAAGLRAAKLSLKTAFVPVIEGLTSHNWYVQQPFVEYIAAAGPEQIEELEVADQISLGRNVLQVADGNERSAKRFLDDIADSSAKWPAPFVKGIFLECFVNDEKKIRLKCDQLAIVLKIVRGLDENKRCKIVEVARKAIECGSPKGVFLGRKEYTKVRDALEAHDWAAPVVEALQAVGNELVSAGLDEE